MRQTVGIQEALIMMIVVMGMCMGLSLAQEDPDGVCGDGIAGNSPGETCDPPGEPSGASGNLCREDCTVCGDAQVNGSEFCDDGNGINEDACRNDCTLGGCGDGILDPGETCDPPGDIAGGNGNPCRINCTVCGDGIVQADEECDDGNGIDDDACPNHCSHIDFFPFCGDGILDPGETCDPPGEVAGGNGNVCREDCTVCGDGIIDPGEECDAPGADICVCGSDCTISICGDAILCPGESCDPPGDPAGGNGNSCREDCTVCGDGIVNAGEGCDDGNGIDDDSCTNSCTIRDCGDMILQEGETCEPPGEPAGGGENLCRENCTHCGDGVLDDEEACDDGNQTGGDLCSAVCEEEPLVACRITGGGTMLVSSEEGYRGSSRGEAASFSGQVGGQSGCVGCFDDLGSIPGHWSHRGPEARFEATAFNSLVCTCDGILEGDVCLADSSTDARGMSGSPGNRACWSGVGIVESKDGPPLEVAFRAEAVDRGRPSEDRYRLLIWLPDPGQTPEEMAAMACCTNPGIHDRPRPMLSHAGAMVRGGIRIHPVAPGEEGSCTSSEEPE